LAFLSLYYAASDLAGLAEIRNCAVGCHSPQLPAN